jgi:Tfp pilus assembly protein PilZ
MKEKNERRALERFEIPGTNVICKKEEGFKLFNRYVNTSTMQNLSKSGICLQLENGINIGDKLKLHLHLPGENSLEIKGHVRWKKNHSGNSNKIGIQFEPFGKGKYLNSLSCLDKLRQIQQQHL